MSTLYNLEPQPTAKVLLQTTSGDILLELFAKQTPIASRNFLQHCLDGYYNGTIFHRIVPSFIIQGGDPTGTGFGGEAAYNDGAPFEDEFHTRLKFNRRGLLGMANSGKSNDNTSQFFITLGNTTELQGKNTLFGRVEGDTIYNVIKMGDSELAEGGDRPLYPTKITGVDILVNPFTDMVKRERANATTSTTEKVPKKKQKRKAGKALLSFGDDGGDDETSLLSSKKPKFNTKLVEGDLPNTTKPAAIPRPKPRSSDIEPARLPSPPHEKELNHQLKEVDTQSLPAVATAFSSDRDSSPSPSPERETKQQKQLKEAQAEIEALKLSLRRNHPNAKVEKPKPKSALEAMIPETSTRGRKRGAAQNATSKDEAAVLAMFNSFKHKLEAVEDIEDASPPAHQVDPSNESKTNTKADPEGEDDEAALCDLHFIVNCQSCSNWTETAHGEADEGEGWLGHKLSFAKDRLGKDLEWKRKNEEELVVVDPREKARNLGVDKVGYSRDDRGKRQYDRDRKARQSGR